MMRTSLVAGLILAAAVPMLNAQSGQTSSQPPAPPAAKTITLTGCVQLDAAKPGWFTLSDTKTGTTYRLTGANVRAYVWRNVRIVGGLVPSPNIAAQAGAIDQTKAAMAYQGAKPPETGIEPLEFNVARVRRLTGSCAKSDQ
jgi:hypothetical protein